MWERAIFIVGLIGLQALEALVLIWGLKIHGRGAWSISFAFILFNLPIFYIFWLIVGAHQPSLWGAALIVRPCYAWQFNWLTFLLFLAPIILFGRAVSWLSGWETLITVLRITILSIVGLWGLATIWGLANTLRSPVVETVEAAIPGFPKEQSGIRLVQWSDPHVGWWNSREEIQRIGKIMAGLKPDLLVITGDLVDHHPDYVHALAAGLDPVRPRLGRYAIIGNHDVYTGREAVAERMEADGFRMLRNRCLSLQDQGARLALAGMEDSGLGWTGPDPDEKKIPEILAGCPVDLPVILLAHRPSAFDRVAGRPVALTLAGHTHGGQLRLPFNGPGLANIGFAHPFGLFRRDDRMLYVNRGTGTVGWPFRLFCPAEITLFILRSVEPPN